MVDWNTNEAGTVHRAEAAIRCSRFLREARIASTYVHRGWNEFAFRWVATIYAKTDMDAPINAGLVVRTESIEVKHFDTLRRAKAWAETWLQP